MDNLCDINVFNYCKVSVNFGPHFQYKPMEEYKPVSLVMGKGSKWNTSCYQCLPGGPL